MALSQRFLLKVAKIDGDKQQLIELMNELEAQKKAARVAMRNISNTPAEEGGLQGKERERKLRGLRTKIDYLKVECEYIKHKISTINTQKKKANRVVHNTSPKFQAAFMAAAEKLLDEKTFLNIENKAAMLISTGIMDSNHAP